MMAGDSHTGVCIMHMEEGLDTGPVYERAEIVIDAATDGGESRIRASRFGQRN